MTKLIWDKFIEKHKDQRYLVTTALVSTKFQIPSGISKKNQKKWPTWKKVITETLTPHIKNDWAIDTQKEALKPRATVTLYRIVFENQADAIVAAKLLNSTQSPATPKTPGFTTQISCPELDKDIYIKYCSAQGYI